MCPEKPTKESDVVFFCAVLRADAVQRKYPGGLNQFVADEGGVVEGNLILLSTMAQGEMNDWLDRMHDVHQLLVGEDIALGEQFHGEIEPCPGVIFIPPTRSMGRWRVKFEPPNDWPVSYAVLSSFQCVESGEIQSNAETEELFDSQRPAFSYARAKEKDLLCRAGLERAQARAMDGAYAPYIVWILLIRLDRAPIPGADILERIRPLLEADEQDRLNMLDRVMYFHGVVFEKTSEEPYSLNEVLEDLADSLA